MRDIFDIYCKPGSDILNVSAGLVEFIPPMALRETAAELVLKSETNNMSEIKYFHMYRERLGDSIYIQAIQFLQQKHYDLGKFSKENILGTSGVSGGVISAIMMLKEKLHSRPGPVKIGLFNPFYVYHREIATGVFGTNVQFVYLDVNEDMSFDFKTIRENAGSLDMIMFTNPGNPSTHVMTKEEVDKFVLVAQEFKHCYFISDEVYSDMIQPGFKHTSFHSPIPENIIVLRGFSKCMAVGSWRYLFSS
ncbi:pyridoxal phosphate-dependent transferase [Globomyces pollinis-pini]|nr:pyridoxal phosphate-dependent transferase [Globomyces pollinis-pini]